MSYQKYLKYKNKYLNLLKLRGGEHEIFKIISKIDDLQRAQKVIEIINTLPDLNIKNSEGFPLLTVAMMSFSNSYIIAKIIIEKGGNINIIDDKINRTPLMHLLSILNKETYEFDEENEYNFVKYLIEKGSDINFENQRYESALYFCAKNRLYDIMELLFIKNVKINSGFFEDCVLLNIMRNSRKSISKITKDYEEMLAIVLVKKGAILKEDNNDFLFQTAHYLKLNSLLTFLLNENYDSEVSGNVYQNILYYAKENHIDYLLNAVKKKIITSKIVVQFGENGVVIEENNKKKIFFQSSTNIEFEGNNKMKTFELKRIVSDLKNIEIDDLVLFIKHNGKIQEMVNERTLEDYGFPIIELKITAFRNLLKK
jgi:hypothetical protein